MRHLPVPCALAIAAAAACAQEMPAPRFKPGDHWNYRETDLLTKNETGLISETVTSVDGDTYWIDARRQARTWWRGDAGKAQQVEQFAYAEGAPDLRGRTLTSSDGGCAYPWPLKPGQKFGCSETVLFPNGWKVRYELKFEVEAAVPLDLPAGRFDCLRLVATGWANNLTTNSNSRHERVIWLAPAAKREVKHEIRTFLPSGRPFRVEGRELMTLKLAD